MNWIRGKFQKEGSAVEATASAPSDEELFAQVWPRIRRIRGLLAPGQEEWLFRSARSLSEGARIVEIGSFLGRSTVSLGYGCLGSRRRVYAIDRFQGIYADLDGHSELIDDFSSGFYDQWWSNVSACGLQDYVTPLAGESLTVAGMWRAPIELIFIDGSHIFEDVLADFEAFLPHVISGGLIALHDVDEEWPGCLRAWNDVVADRLVETGHVGSLAYGRKP